MDKLSYQGNSCLSDEEEECCNLVIDEEAADVDNFEGKLEDTVGAVRTSEQLKPVKKEVSPGYLQIEEADHQALENSKKHPIKSLEMVVNNIIGRNFSNSAKQEKSIENALKSPAIMTMSSAADKINIDPEMSSTSSSQSPVVCQIKVEPGSENTSGDSPVSSSPIKSPVVVKTEAFDDVDYTIPKPTVTERQHTKAFDRVDNVKRDFKIAAEKQPTVNKSATTMDRNVSPNPPPPTVVTHPHVPFPYSAMMNNGHSSNMFMAGPMPSLAGHPYAATGFQTRPFAGAPYDFTAAAAATAAAMTPFAHGYRPMTSPTDSHNKGISQLSPSPTTTKDSVVKTTQSQNPMAAHKSHHSNRQPGTKTMTPNKKYFSEDKENSPLDLTVGCHKKVETNKSEEPIRRAEKRLTGDAPIDLAPKRIKTEPSKMQSAPLKSTPLRPTPVSQPNWYSDCLSKLASSVNQKNGLDQKTSPSSAFKPITPQTSNNTPLIKNSSSPALPLPAALPQFGMLPAPWGMGLGMDPTAVMMGMINPFLMGGPLPGMLPQGLTTTTFRETIRYEVKATKTELAEICKKMDGSSSLSKLSSQFHFEVDRLENDRQRLLSSLHGMEKESVSAYYDNQIYMLICTVKTQLQLEKKTLELGSKLKADSSSNNLLTMPNVPVPAISKTSPSYNDTTKITPPSSRLHNFSLDQGASPMHMSTPRSLSSGSEIGSNGSTIRSPNNSGDSSNESGFLDSSDISPNDQGYGSAQKRRFLSTAAIQILSDWYSEHLDHPYPDEEDVEELAKKANVSECQVKKWMANKRVRSSNTLSFNGSIHPKKLQKLLQIKEASGSNPKPTEVPEVVKAEEPAQIPASVASQYGGLLNQVQVSNGQVTFTNGEKSIVIPHKAPRKQKAKRLLDPKAVEGMNTWYFNHLEYPYPTDDEKQKLADDNQLSVAQVTCWFANKRNRSNNTRKMTPKMMKRPEPSFVTGHMMASPQLPMGFMSSPATMNSMANMAGLPSMPAFPTMLSQPSH